MKVYIHVDSNSTYVGNGGFVTLSNLALRLIDMGYEVYMFDQNNQLNYKMFDWLCLDRKIPIIKTWNITLDDDSRVITSWLRTLPDKFRNPSFLRFLESSELIRNGHELEREFIIKNNVKVANLHRNLNDLYCRLGIRNIVNLEVWIRDDVKFIGKEKIENSVGIQLEKKRIFKIFSIFDWSGYEKFKEWQVIICNGNYRQVIDKMNMADFFIHNPKPSPYIKIFKGETFGLPLFEAMACGCVCIARKHEGIKFLDGIIPLVENMQEAKEILIQLKNDKKEKEEIRNKSLAFIEKNYRFNDERRNAILRWLE